MKSASKFFSPIKIGKLEIKNRLFMDPMGLFGLVTHEGVLTQRA